MKKHKKLVLAGLCLVGLYFVARHYTTRDLDMRDVVAGEIVADFDDDVSPEYVEKLGKELGLQFRPESSYTSTDKIYVAEYDGDDEEGVIEALRSNSHVEAADKEVIYTIPEHNMPADEEGVLAGSNVGIAGSFPNDPRYTEQWGMAQIHLPKNWKDGDAGKGVIVAVLDTGVTRTQDLQGTKFVKGYNFISNNENTEDGNSHGTHVAGTIAQTTNNNRGVAGVAYAATIMPVKVLSDGGSGSTAGIAQGVRFAADHGAKVINMSLGGGGKDQVFANAMKYAHAKGVTIVCASGNSSRGEVSYPAKYPEAIAVAATRKDEKVTSYSNWGKEIAIAAPGGDGDRNKPENGILQNTISEGKDDYYFFNGTSMASPHVAGVAALVIAKGITKPDDVRKVLTETARKPKGVKIDSKFAEHYGSGIVDAGAAVKAASGGLLSGTPWYVYVLVVFAAFVIYAVVKRKRKV